MGNTVRLAFVVVLVAGLAACSQVAPKGPGVNPAAVSGTTRTLSFMGSATLQASSQGTQYGIQSPEFPTMDLEHDIGTAGGAALQAQSATTPGRGARLVNRMPAKTRVPASPPKGSQASLGAQSLAPQAVTAATSFQGLNHFQQRYADNGNQFSLEPPDQGMCVGNGYVMEAVNDVAMVYNPDGSAAWSAPASLNEFFYGNDPINRHAINRTTGVYGAFITDPSCHYDASSGHWYLVVLTLDVDPASGAFTGSNHLDLAVSQTNDPTGAWYRYSLDVTNDGSPNCPCLGDYPHFAYNADGLFITTDSFSFFGSDYYGAWLYGIEKSAINQGSSSANVVATSLPDTAGDSYSVAPALTVGTPQSGTQYMVSATTAYATSSSTIAVWAVTNTDSLSSGHPRLSVASTLVDVGGANGLSSGSYGDVIGYAVPQKSGDVPLAQALTANKFGYGSAGKQFESPVATNDSGMKQAVYVNGHLYSALTTTADNGAGLGGGPGAGAAWFDVTPTLSSGHGRSGGFSATLDHAGVVAPQGRNVIFPAITVNQAGQGAMAVTLVGPNDYPSAAVIPFDAGSATAGAPSVLMSGVGPQDGFTGYWLGGYSPRWGDYGAAAVDPATGDLWLASEAIHQTCTYRAFLNDTTCGGTRSALANWSTQISKVTP